MRAKPLCLNSVVDVVIVSMVQKWEFVQQNTQKLAIAHLIAD
ncbi:hypothetical protein NIES2104_66210 [Leptolyngbya sp. NIES-2104]|nr:hypothetical protein NIES2104_66210 [Leptolyngbya sp. NIES-2104]